MSPRISCACVSFVVLIGQSSAWPLGAASSSMSPRISCACVSFAVLIGQSSAWSSVAPQHVSIFGNANGRTLGSSSRIGQREMALSSTAPSVSATTTTKEDSNGQLRTLYPPSNATNNGTLKVDSTHTLYYEQYNDPKNAAQLNNALFLHGGPGAGCFPNHARFFSPDHYRVTLLDQRGCGRSTPKGETSNNTLMHLVEDVEALRIQLGYDRWDVLLGGSWGTTVALAYAQTYPERVGGMVLRGVCLFRQAEIDWLFAKNGGADKLKPESWKEFESSVGIIDAEETKLTDSKNRDALHRYYDCLLGSDAVLRGNAMKNWMKWEMSIFSSKEENKTNAQAPDQPLLVWDNRLFGWSFQDAFGAIDEGETDALAAKKAESLRRFSSDEVSPVAGIECGDIDSTVSSPRPIDENIKQKVELHKLPPNVTEEQARSFIPAQAMLTCYFSSNVDFCMGPYRNLLSTEGIKRLRNIPCIAVQGGLDAICPPDSALDLVREWPEMELRIPLDAGHSMYHADICSELVKATDRCAGL